MTQRISENWLDTILLADGSTDGETVVSLINDLRDERAKSERLIEEQDHARARVERLDLELEHAKECSDKAEDRARELGAIIKVPDSYWRHHFIELEAKYNALREAVEAQAVKLYASGHYTHAIYLRKLLTEGGEGQGAEAPESEYPQPIRNWPALDCKKCFGAGSIEYCDNDVLSAHCPPCPDCVHEVCPKCGGSGKEPKE